MDIGLYFFSRGWSVTWVSRDAERMSLVERTATKRATRVREMLGGEGDDREIRFALLGRCGASPADVLIEAGAEDLTMKRRAVAMEVDGCGSQCLVASTSSSILPELIHPQAIGMHFFYPVALTTYAELVFPTTCLEDVRRRAAEVARRMSLSFVEQGPTNAFYLNRVLLPLQAELLRQLLLGRDIEALDEASASGLLPRGQVALMNEVGLDVFLASVENYVVRMSSAEAKDYRHLRAALSAMVASGLRGKKNRRPLSRESVDILHGQLSETWTPLCGRVAPEEMAEVFNALFLNTCLGFVAGGQCDLSSLSDGLKAVFGGDETLEQALDSFTRKDCRRLLEGLYTETGISYFNPCRRLY